MLCGSTTMPICLPGAYARIVTRETQRGTRPKRCPQSSASATGEHEMGVFDADEGFAGKDRRKQQRKFCQPGTQPRKDGAGCRDETASTSNWRTMRQRWRRSHCDGELMLARAATASRRMEQLAQPMMSKSTTLRESVQGAAGFLVSTMMGCSARCQAETPECCF